MAKDPTMQDIADAAGVSRMTVSLALRGHTSIPKRTIARISRIADELGYRPNPLVSSLMAQMRRTHDRKVSVAIAYITAGKNESPTLKRYYEGAQRRARELGYQLTLFDLGSEPLTDSRLSKILWTRNIQGAIFAPYFPRKDIHLDWTALSPVAIGYILPGTPINRVSTNHFNNVATTVKELRKHHAKRPALAIVVGLEKEAVRYMQGGFRLAAPRNVDLLEYLPRKWRKDHFLAWLRKYQPDAVLGIRANLRTALEEESKLSGRSYTFVQLDLQPDDSYMGIDQNSTLVGSAAVDNVVAQLNNNVRGLPQSPKTILIDGSWVEGDRKFSARQGNIEHAS